MAKRIIPLLLAALLLTVPLGGCAGGTAGTEPSDGRITISASFYPVYIMTLNIAKGMPDVNVVDMTQPTTGCLHDYTPTADDMKNLDRAQFLVINGAGMENFMGKVIEQFPDLKIVDSGKDIPLIRGPGDEGDNPHIWVSISNAIRQVKNIAEQLSALDPKDAAAFTVNADAYVKKLNAEKDKMHKALDDLPNRDIVTFHEAFPYFAAEFNLRIAAVIEREPGSEPSARELDDTIATINRLRVKALFAEPQYPASAAEAIADETGSKVYTLDPAVTGPEDADAYLNIMDSNLKVLQEALK